MSAPCLRWTQFLLTRPSRGATTSLLPRRRRTRISTHTPLAGRDLTEEGMLKLDAHFYSHAPRGARLIHTAPPLSDRDFYSHAPRGARPGLLSPIYKTRKFLLTRPSRGATACDCGKDGANGISTHTPLAGRDGAGFICGRIVKNFYSHAPRGARRTRSG